MTDSISDLHLPYQAHSHHINDERGGKYNHEMLATFIENVSAISNCVAACLLTGSVHGYGFQAAIVQVNDGACFRQSWVEGATILANSSAQRIGEDFDLQKELLSLRNGSWTFRSIETVNHNLDQKTGIEGRIATLFIATGTDTEWLTCSRLLLRVEYLDNPLNRILIAVEDLAGKVVLV
jgi:hypothetical protein